MNLPGGLAINTVYDPAPDGRSFPTKDHLVVSVSSSLVYRAPRLSRRPPHPTRDLLAPVSSSLAPALDRTEEPQGRLPLDPPGLASNRPWCCAAQCAGVIEKDPCFGRFHRRAPDVLMLRNGGWRTATAGRTDIGRWVTWRKPLERSRLDSEVSKSQSLTL